MASGGLRALPIRWAERNFAYNAASTASYALRSRIVQALYAIGTTACVFHLGNGLWTMGITWGVWTTPKAQRRAGWLCGFIGVATLVVGLMPYSEWSTSINKRRCKAKIRCTRADASCWKCLTRLTSDCQRKSVVRFCRRRPTRPKSSMNRHDGSPARSRMASSIIE